MININLFELNQTNYALLPTLNKEELKKSKKEIKEYLQAHKEYFLMLEKEQRYYTVFCYGNARKRNYDKMANEILAIVTDLGEIKSIEVDEIKIEFWILPKGEEECRLYMFFDYDGGVIEVNE